MPGEDAVIPASFAYHRPKSVNEAVGLLADLGEDAARSPAATASSR